MILENLDIIEEYDSAGVQKLFIAFHDSVTLTMDGSSGEVTNIVGDFVSVAVDANTSVCSDEGVQVNGVTKRRNHIVTFSYGTVTANILKTLKGLDLKKVVVIGLDATGKYKVFGSASGLSNTVGTITSGQQPTDFQGYTGTFSGVQNLQAPFVADSFDVESLID